MWNAGSLRYFPNLLVLHLAHLYPRARPLTNSPLWSLSKAVNLVFLVIITLLFYTSFISSYSFKLNYIIRVIDTVPQKGWELRRLLPGDIHLSCGSLLCTLELWVSCALGDMGWGGGARSLVNPWSCRLISSVSCVNCIPPTSLIPKRGLKSTSIHEEWNGGFRGLGLGGFEKLRWASA